MDAVWGVEDISILSASVTPPGPLEPFRAAGLLSTLFQSRIGLESSRVSGYLELLVEQALGKLWPG